MISDISKLKGVNEIAMTTNGTMLEDYAEKLKGAGLARLNISLDTLDKDKYKQITRGGNLDKVLNGIKAARNAGGGCRERYW